MTYGEKDNKMKYIFDRDWGAGILNAGYCICNNCSYWKRIIIINKISILSLINIH